MSGPSVELTVDAIAAGGSGVGRTAEGQVVFLPRTAPGDRVVAELVERRRRWARGRVVTWLRAGPGRVRPPCPIYETCGGCRIQHLDAERQAVALEGAVADTLARIGGVEVPVDPLVRGERAFGYRNRVTFTLRRDGDAVVAGYHAESGPGLVPVERCPLAEPAVSRAWDGLRAGWGDAARRLPPGGELRLTLRGTADGRVGLYIEGGRAATPPPAGAVDALLRDTPGLASVWWDAADGPRRHLAGEAWLAEPMEQGPPLRLRPRAFLQVNREVAARIDRHVDEILGPPEGRALLDLYAGVGLRAIRWARRGGRPVAVEREPDAVATGTEAARAAGVDVRFVADTVERALDAGATAEVVVVNPPRSGLDEAAAAGLSRLRAHTLVYVSCDPATLARDVKRLAGGWRPRGARPFDAFPHTGHVETVLWLERAGGAP